MIRQDYYVMSGAGDYVETRTLVVRETSLLGVLVHSEGRAVDGNYAAEVSDQDFDGDLYEGVWFDDGSMVAAASSVAPGYPGEPPEGGTVKYVIGLPE